MANTNAESSFSEYARQQQDNPELSPTQYAANLQNQERQEFYRLVEEFFEVGGVLEQE